MRKNIKKINEKANEKSLEEIWTEDEFDPNGSYTGTSEDYRRPIQDADDL
jgi:hypothetical protein